MGRSGQRGAPQYVWWYHGPVVVLAGGVGCSRKAVGIVEVQQNSSIMLQVTPPHRSFSSI